MSIGGLGGETRDSRDDIPYKREIGSEWRVAKNNKSKMYSAMKNKARSRLRVIGVVVSISS